MNQSPTSNLAATPRRSPPWARILLILFAGLAVLAVLGAVGARWWLQQYLHSDQFRRMIGQKTSQALRVNGEFMPLHWDGASAYTDGFVGRGIAGSPWKEIRADQIRAELDLTGIWQRQCRVRDMQIQRLEAEWQRTGLADVADAANAAPPPAENGRLRIDFGPIRIDEASLFWPMGHFGQGSIRRLRGELVIQGKNWQATGEGGKLTVPGWPGFNVRTLRVRSDNGAITIADAGLDLVDGGSITVTGSCRAGASQSYDLDVQFTGLPAENWLPPDWRGRVLGRASGQCAVRGQFSQPEATGVAGKIDLGGGRLEALPVLNRVALFTGTEQFRSLTLNKATAEFRWDQPRLVIRNVDVESTGLLRVTGGCVMVDDNLDGEFDVGVAARALRWIPGARSRVFTTERDGYLWTRVKVYGPVSSLKEDLSERLIVAAGAGLIEGTTDTIDQGIRDLLDILRKQLP